MNASATLALPWQADCGDGTYRNPILFADYSDPDAVRVGDDYWMTASSFSHVPGLPILHSRDLVNWTLVNHALPQLVPADHFWTPQHGSGVWAPAIRHHARRFWITYPDPEYGIYMVSAADPRGRWSDPVLLRPGIGIIDPCPFWDDDGRAYLVHALSRSRSLISNRLILHELTPDGGAIADEAMLIVDGDQIPGWHTLEGPKLYKRAGYYYIFAPAGGVPQGFQAVLRSRQIRGPYEARIVLDQGGTAVNGPHQGAWVDTPHGEHWFLHFQDRGPFGRVVHLQPLVWRDDDWPVIGADPDGDGRGEPVLTHRKPALPVQPVAAPACSDEFDHETLGLQWQWQANPRRGWAALRIRRGWLRLTAIPVDPTENLWLSPNLLLQKFPAPAFAATTRLEFAPAMVGDRAGLVVFGLGYAWIGLQRTADGLRLVHHRRPNARDGETVVEVGAAEIPEPRIDLRVRVDAAARCEFSYSLDGRTFHPLGAGFQATPSLWVGAKVGLFAVAPPEAARAGHADFDWFHVEAAP